MSVPYQCDGTCGKANSKPHEADGLYAADENIEQLRLGVGNSSTLRQMAFCTEWKVCTLASMVLIPSLPSACGAIEI